MLQSADPVPGGRPRGTAFVAGATVRPPRRGPRRTGSGRGRRRSRRARAAASWVPCSTIAAAVHDEDRVGVADRRQAVGDDERRPAVHQPGHRALDEDLGPRVDRGGRLVEDEDRRVGEERAGDRQQLLLAGRQVGRVVVDDGVVAVGQRPHEVVDVGGLGGRDDLVLGGAVAGRRRCSRGSCRGTATCPGGPSRTSRRRSSRVRSRVSIAVDRDPAAVDLVEAHQQVDERRLAGAGRADDGDRLAGRRRSRSRSSMSGLSGS